MQLEAHAMWAKCHESSSHVVTHMLTQLEHVDNVVTVHNTHQEKSIVLSSADCLAESRLTFVVCILLGLLVSGKCLAELTLAVTMTPMTRATFAAQMITQDNKTLVVCQLSPCTLY